MSADKSQTPPAGIGTTITQGSLLAALQYQQSGTESGTQGLSASDLPPELTARFGLRQRSTGTDGDTAKTAAAAEGAEANKWSYEVVDFEPK